MRFGGIGTVRTAIERIHPATIIGSEAIDL
jgi:hypothetical protein